MNSTGTSQQQITVPDFKNTKIVVPPVDILSAFMNTILPIFKTIDSNKLEIGRLSTLQRTILSTISTR